MRIKRFTAPDMRTALRMVRDEQGPDAVILSTRPGADGAGIEVVAATDYDEALVAQALRAAAPGIEELPARPLPTPAPAAAPAGRRDVAIAAATQADAATSTGARDSLMSRARAVFRIGDGPTGPSGPTLAELTAGAAPAAPATSTAPVRTARADAAPAPAPAPATIPAQVPAAPVTPAPAAAAAAQPAQAPAPGRFEAMMAALDAGPARDAEPEDFGRLPEIPMPERPEPVEAPRDAAPAPVPAAATASATDAAPTAPRPLQIVATPELDPAIVSMREEMARMRQLMEAQMQQLSLERLRGSPARAAALDALAGYGCEESLAREVAACIDPTLAPEAIHAPMLAELARMLPIVRSEPIEEGGVIALVGPTGAGKTTTIAKLAARFAARHRARDVALVTTDCERAGALEQLQALGRRLGITVCEAQGPERLQEALEQLVDYPLVLVDTTGHAPRDRAVFSQILWLRAAKRVRSLLVLPANAHPHDLGEVIRRYRPAKPEGVVLTKLDETGRPGSALSVLARHGLGLAYTTGGQQVPSDLDAADAVRLVQSLEKTRRAADNPLATEDRHAVA
ncbi:MAG TPA: flagellar biosynthesis protein FlhF [Luteimonas sp.]|nr:flagellar biosynthesis protein FlhF [Luteimonas sp.]